MNAVFKALNDPTRRQILELLREKDLTAGEIAEKFSMSWPSRSAEAGPAGDIGERGAVCILLTQYNGSGRNHEMVYTI